ncbi:MAG: UDP-N-acetylmuramate dehydrogenase [Saprospiraceae bacterium]|nr:UDP-N-acetylmuramate dehydrogenase [Saprospiraceae bacterium]MCZ2336619.1 UDP-N-acetylmuramate dehydrogenase [Chitinophagales bacterium]
METSLYRYNTFGFDAECMGIHPIETVDDLMAVIKQGIHPIKIIGGGSNVLLTGDVPSFVLHNAIKGIQVIGENDQQVFVSVGSGELWHDLVIWSLDHHLGGLENLSLIPGTVGAAPMQNIGAYGVEQNHIFHSLKAIHLSTGERKVFTGEECAFGYRESIFKHKLKDQYFITQVVYALSKPPHSLHINYGAIQEVLNKQNITQPTIKDVSNAVIEIRRSKLPDPTIIGNAGSFFKNPVISRVQFEQILSNYPGLPHYPAQDEQVKIPAGWLIEQCGFKGFTIGHVGVHKNQALVLVHYGNGSGSEIVELAREIQKAVLQRFGIEIQPEVNFW